MLTHMYYDNYPFSRNSRKIIAWETDRQLKRQPTLPNEAEIKKKRSDQKIIEKNVESRLFENVELSGFPRNLQVEMTEQRNENANLRRLLHSRKKQNTRNVKKIFSDPRNSKISRDY